MKGCVDGFPYRTQLLTLKKLMKTIKFVLLIKIIGFSIPLSQEDLERARIKTIIHNSQILQNLRFDCFESVNHLTEEIIELINEKTEGFESDPQQLKEVIEQTTTELAHRSTLISKLITDEKDFIIALESFIKEIVHPLSIVSWFPKVDRFNYFLYF